MADSKNVTVQVGPGFSGLLFLVFLMLKLTGYIDWSWWWITAPLWGPVVLILAILTLLLVAYLLVGAVGAIWVVVEQWRRRP